MKCDYVLDITEESSSTFHTPSLLSQRLPFYIHNCGHFYANQGYYTEREGLDNYLLIYTVSGNGILQYKGAEYMLKPGEVFIISCVDHHFYRTGPEGTWEIKWVHFNGSACRSYLDLIAAESSCIVSLPDPSFVERSLDEMPELIIKNDILSDARLSMLMTGIITEIVANRLSPANNRKYQQHSEIIGTAADYIKANYARDINMDAILKRVHISEYHFIRLFKKYTGMSPYEYLINYRVNKSKALLKETGLTINEISFKVGFNNVNNFIRDFKKLVGTTPLKYRNFWVT
jgi:AraC-like DNA-binding protein